MYIEVRKLQEKLLDILLYFDNFCKENNLRYYLCGGCLIGALRHKGFIPWDDDVDVFMPREDYEKLNLIWESKGDTSRYCYCRTDEKNLYHHGGASIRDKNTTMINRHSSELDICHGLALEAIPIDACPSSWFGRASQLYNAFVFNLFNVQRLPDNKGKLIRLISKVILGIVRSPRHRYRIWKKAQARMTKYRWDECNEVTELIGSIKGMMVKHPKIDFDSGVDLEFEGHMLPTMRGYKSYMEKIWGDYMQLPPVEKRVSKHDLVYLSIDEPYEKFKGVYYCAKKD